MQGLEKDYAAAASGLTSWHCSQDAASAALRAKHRLQRQPTAGRVKRNGRAAFSPKLSDRPQTFYEAAPARPERRKLVASLPTTRPH